MKTVKTHAKRSHTITAYYEGLVYREGLENQALAYHFSYWRSLVVRESLAEELEPEVMQ